MFSIALYSVSQWAEMRFGKNGKITHRLNALAISDGAIRLEKIVILDSKRMMDVTRCCRRDATSNRLELATAKIGTRRSRVFRSLMLVFPITGKMSEARLCKILKRCAANHFLLLACHARATSSNEVPLRTSNCTCFFCAPGFMPVARNCLV